MKNYLKFLETARKEGVRPPHTENFKNPNINKFTWKEWKAIESCMPFVFVNSMTEAEAEALIAGEKADEVPFPVFSIEILNGFLIELSEEATSDRVRSFLSCIVVIERSPLVFSYFGLMEGHYASDLVSIHNQVYPKQKIQGQVYSAVEIDARMAEPLVKKFTDRLNREKTGAETVGVTVKIGDKHNKRFHKIKKIIYVAPGKLIKSEHNGLSKTIDWTHRFEVRGHWRKTDMLGKDREGNYCVEGFTWVVNHIRGPEHLPLIKKTRLVVEPKQQEPK